MIALNEIPHYRTLAPILLEHGANPNTPSWRRNYRVSVSLRVNELEVHEVDMRELVRSYRKETPLVVATRHGDLELMKLMIAKGADVNARQFWKDLEMPLVDLMIKRGARNYAPQLPDEEPSALEVAADNLHEEAFFLLLQHGATVDSEILGRLSHSVFSNSTAGMRIVTALLDQGTDVNAPASAGQSTPLMAATQKFNVTLVQLLLRRGANPNQYSGYHSPVTWIESLEWSEGAHKEALAVRRLILAESAED